MKFSHRTLVFHVPKMHSAWTRPLSHHIVHRFLHLSSHWNSTFAQFAFIACLFPCVLLLGVTFPLRLITNLFDLASCGPGSVLSCIILHTLFSTPNRSDFWSTWDECDSYKNHPTFAEVRATPLVTARNLYPTVCCVKIRAHFPDWSISVGIKIDFPRLLWTRSRIVRSMFAFYPLKWSDYFKNLIYVEYGFEAIILWIIRRLLTRLNLLETQVHDLRIPYQLETDSVTSTYLRINWHHCFRSFY